MTSKMGVGGDSERQSDLTSESVTPWAWRFRYSGRDPRPLPESFFLLKTEIVARELLGCYLRSTVGGVVAEGVIVETEAYVGPHDPASHAAARIGKTERNKTMFGHPGHAYVYRSYGIHWCLNVVTEEVGFPAAVLIRALDPIVGVEEMRERRGGAAPLCAGPGRLTQALGVSGELDGHPMWEEPLTLSSACRIPVADVGVSARIGVRRASDWRLRFYVQGHPEVSGRPR
ncbi:MAG: DNA-3-methyladenine glycosylase [Gemmatimonadota bacterium]